MVNADWSIADATLDLKLKSSKKYLQDSIFSIRKLANKRGGPPVASQTGVTYVNGWKVEGLSILQNKFSRDTPILLQTQILEALQQSFVVQSCNFKQKIQFLKFKKEEAIVLRA